MRAILIFRNCDGQSDKTVSTDHNLFEEKGGGEKKKGEPKQIRTEVRLLSSLTPYRWAKPALARRQKRDGVYIGLEQTHCTRM